MATHDVEAVEQTILERSGEQHKTSTHAVGSSGCQQRLMRRYELGVPRHRGSNRTAVIGWNGAAFQGQAKCGSLFLRPERFSDRVLRVDDDVLDLSSRRVRSTPHDGDLPPQPGVTASTAITGTTEARASSPSRPCILLDSPPKRDTQPSPASTAPSYPSAPSPIQSTPPHPVTHHVLPRAAANRSARATPSPPRSPRSTRPRSRACA